MSLQVLPGGLWAPAVPNITHNFHALRATTLIDATGEKAAMMGRVWWPDRASTKSITRVHIRFGTVVTAGGSALTVSLQDLSTTANNPLQPDGVQDQTVAVPNVDIVSNAWYRTNALSANRTVAFGEALAVVIEYDGAGRLGSDSVTVGGLRAAGLTVAHLGQADTQNSLALYTTSWGVSDFSIANVLLEFSDGTFGTFMNGWPVSNAGALTYNSGSTPDEYALRFQFPVNTKIDGAWLSVGAVSAAATVDVVLYQGTTVLQTVTINPYNFATFGASTMQPIYIPFPETSISANTTYYLAYKPNSANNVYLNYIDVNANAHFQAHQWGVEWYMGSRTDAGAWTDTNTRRPLMGLHVSSMDNGVGAGGGALLTHPGMSGGMRG